MCRRFDSCRGHHKLNYNPALLKTLRRPSLPFCCQAIRNCAKGFLGDPMKGGFGGGTAWGREGLVRYAAIPLRNGFYSLLAKKSVPSIIGNSRFFIEELVKAIRIRFRTDDDQHVASMDHLEGGRVVNSRPVSPFYGDNNQVEIVPDV